MVAQCLYYLNNPLPTTPSDAVIAQIDPKWRSNRAESGPTAQPPPNNQLSENDGDQDQESLGDEDAADGVDVEILKSDQQQVLADESFSEDIDDGCDGELIIDEEDDSYVNPLTISSGSTSDKARTPILAQGCEQSIYSSIRHRTGTRNETQQKMEEGKQWLMKSFMFVNSVLNVVPLSSIEEAYQTYCKETKKEALTTPVLARLIRGLFPGAVKCRLGPRGSQRIHYRNLMLQSQSAVGMHESLKMPGHHFEASTAIDKPVNDCVSLTVKETTNISVQEKIQHKEDCVLEKANSKELCALDEGEDKKHLSHGASVPDEGEDKKPISHGASVPDERGDKKHVNHGASVPDEGGDKKHVNHGASVPDEGGDKKHVNHGASVPDEGGDKKHVNHGASVPNEGGDKKHVNHGASVPDEGVDKKHINHGASVPDEGDDKKHVSHGVAAEKSSANQDGKACTTEAPNRKDVKSHITIDDDQEGSQCAAQGLSQELFAPDDKQHISHGASGETSVENQDRKTCTTESPNQKNLETHITLDDPKGCQPAAQRLSQVLRWISCQGRRDVLLREFAHSASCQVVSCTPLCSMFRRVRRHVVAARHSCYVLRIYSGLLRLHVSSCNNIDCGLPACPALRATRPLKRTLVQQGNSSKRSAVQQPGGVSHPLTLALSPRSPPTSLPGSPVNSPPASPEHFLRDLRWPAQTGQVQYVIVPVLPVAMPLSDNRGA